MPGAFFIIYLAPSSLVTATKHEAGDARKSRLSAPMECCDCAKTSIQSWKDPSRRLVSMEKAIEGIEPLVAVPTVSAVGQPDPGACVGQVQVDR